jgi:hypothetical protein
MHGIDVTNNTNSADFEAGAMMMINDDAGIIFDERRRNAGNDAKAEKIEQTEMLSEENDGEIMWIQSVFPPPWCGCCCCTRHVLCLRWREGVISVPGRTTAQRGDRCAMWHLHLIL